jgi:hypothetical protein
VGVRFEHEQRCTDPVRRDLVGGRLDLTPPFHSRGGCRPAAIRAPAAFCIAPITSGWSAGEASFMMIGFANPSGWSELTRMSYWPYVSKHNAGHRYPAREGALLATPHGGLGMADLPEGRVRGPRQDGYPDIAIIANIISYDRPCLSMVRYPRRSYDHIAAGRRRKPKHLAGSGADSE